MRGRRAWSNVDVLHTVGQTLNLLPPILFLHVFLAFLSGRLERPFERAVVAVAYVTGIGLGFVRMLLGGFGPNSVFELTTEPCAADFLERVQLVTSSACALAGIRVLVVGGLAAQPASMRTTSEAPAAALRAIERAGGIMTSPPKQARSRLSGGGTTARDVAGP